MVNFGLNSASILGIVLAVAGAGLYFLRSVRPELARDHDIFFAAVGLLCGFILVFQGWRLDPILQFGQLLLIGSTIFFAVESIRLRNVATEQAKRTTRIVDEDRPVSPVYQYQAEIDDDYEPLEEERVSTSRPRISGTRDSRSSRQNEYEDDPRRLSADEYEDEPRRRSTNRSSSTQRVGATDKQPSARKRRPASRSTSRSGSGSEDEWGSTPPTDSNWDESSRQVNKPRANSNYAAGVERTEQVSRPRKRRSPETSSRRKTGESAPPSDYVDYKPIDQLDDDVDNAANFNDDL